MGKLVFAVNNVSDSDEETEIAPTVRTAPSSTPPPFAQFSYQQTIKSYGTVPGTSGNKFLAIENLNVSVTLMTMLLS